MSRWKSSGASSYDPPFPPTNKKPPESEIRSLFEALDKDGNGYIDRNELRSTMMDVGLNLSESDINTMMQVANVPIKDRIFYEDFVKMMAGRIGHSQRRALFKKREAQGPSTYTICEGEEEDRDIQAMRIAFSMFDHDGDGLISVQEVLETMTSLGIMVTLKEVKQIVKKVDLDGDGSINFEEFSLAIRKHQAKVVDEVPLNLTTTNLETRIPLRTQELAEAFKVFDKDRDGYLNADDLKNTMQQLGLTLTESDLRAMMKSAKIGPGGRISFSDFCRIYSNQNSMEIVPHTKQNDSKKTFTNKLTKQQEIAEIRAVFYLFDMDKDGFITKDEVEEVLLSMGVHPSQECISQVFQQVDLDGNGKIDFDEFLLLVRKYERPLPEEVEAREMFRAMDRDGNGFIDTVELKASFGALGVPLSDEDVKVMMEEANIKTNKIFFKDFLRIMSGKFGASFSQNTSFDSECSLDLNFHNFSSRDKTKSKTLTRQHAHDRLMDNLEESEKEELMATQEAYFEEHKDKPLQVETCVDRRSKMLTASANATSLEVQEFFRESLNTELTPVSLDVSATKVPQQQNIPRSSNDQQQTTNALIVSTKTTTTTSTATAKTTSNKTDFSKKSQQRPVLAKGTPPSTWVAFKVFDRNADGYISKSELYRTMVELGINLSKEDLESMMIKADINKDGRIDYAEFSKLMMGSFEVYAKQAAQLSEKRSSVTAPSSSSHVPQTLHTTIKAQHHHHQQLHHSQSSFHSNGTAVTVGKTSSSLCPITTNTLARHQREETSAPENSSLPQTTQTQNHIDRHILSPQPQHQPQQNNQQHQPQQQNNQQHQHQPQQNNQQPQQQQQQQQRCNKDPPARSRSTEDEMRAAFRFFDMDGNGLIDAVELKQTMQELDEILTDKDVEAMIVAVDKNGDGKVDYEEFLQLLRFTRTEGQMSR